MRAVIQRSVTPVGESFPKTQWAARDGDLWVWLDGPVGAYVCADFAAAERQAAALRTPGVAVWAAVRESSWDSGDVYAATCARLGEHEI